ncbi:MAG TPA: hypothetical protein VIJ36_10340, partial [Thermoanaerobaculia bacterium]
MPTFVATRLPAGSTHVNGYGICGPLTIGAIRRFQQHHFGWQDGRVDVNNVTMAKLNEFDLDPAT